MSTTEPQSAPSLQTKINERWDRLGQSISTEIPVNFKHGTEKFTAKVKPAGNGTYAVSVSAPDAVGSSRSYYG